MAERSRSLWPLRWLAALLFAAAAAAAQAGPGFEVSTVDGRTLSGVVTATAESVRIAPGSGEPLTVTIGDLIAMQRTDVASLPPAPVAPLFVWLRSGSVLPASRVDGVAPKDGQPARWIVETPAGARLELPQTTVAALRSRPIEPETFERDRAAPDQNADYLFVVKEGKPQRFRVTIESVHDGRVHFDLGGNKFDFPLDGDDSTAAIVLGKNTGFAPDRQPKPRVVATLVTGERCEGKLLAIDATVALLLDEGARLVVPVDRLLSIEVATDKLTWLSTLEPRVEQTAAFDRKWPWTTDGSPAGPGIRLGGKRYARGLVLVPRTRLVYDLGGRYDLFEATIGIDERGGPQAHAIFRVLGDGKILFESEPVVLGSGPQVLRIELGRCKDLAIEADFGKNFDLGDLCAFADARVVQH